MIRARVWLPLVIALVLNAGANVLLKIGAKTRGPLGTEAGLWQRTVHFLNAATAAAIVLFAANVLVYRKALEDLNVSVAYPTMVSGGLILVTLAAALLPALDERISPLQVVGMALIALGVWLVCWPRRGV